MAVAVVDYSSNADDSSVVAIDSRLVVAVLSTTVAAVAINQFPIAFHPRMIVDIAIVSSFDPLACVPFSFPIPNEIWLASIPYSYASMTYSDVPIGNIVVPTSHCIVPKFPSVSWRPIILVVIYDPWSYS